MPDEGKPYRRTKLTTIKGGREGGKGGGGGASPPGEPPPTSEGKPILVTEDALALIFEARHAGQLLFDWSVASWFLWTGSKWARESTGLAFEWARKVARWSAEGSDKVSAITTAAKSSFASGVEKFSRSSRAFAVIATEWDQGALLLGTPSGTVDLATGLLRSADPGERITKNAAVAPAATADCPLWLRFLEEATAGDRDLQRYMQQIAGYGLTGDTREQCLFFIHGDGGNGKGVFVNVVKAVMGEYAINASMDTFVSADKSRHTTELARLQGARFVTASETEEGRSWAESRIKSLTGGDEVTARFMRQDDFTFRPQFKLLIIGNHKPSLHNVDEAMRRRFNLIPFVNKPAIKNLQLEEELKAEWPGILRWMIDGCLDWQRNGLVRPDVVIASTNDYFSEQDLMSQWLAERCDVDRQNPHKWERSADLFADWKAYARAAGDEAGNTKTFGEAMRKKGFAKHATTNARGFKGIRIKTDARESAFD